MKSREELEALKEEIDALREQRAELTDEELAQVDGGAYYQRVLYRTKAKVQFVHRIGDIVEVSHPFWFGTIQCRITKIEVREDAVSVGGVSVESSGSNKLYGYSDFYYCEEVNYHWHFPNGWYRRDSIEIPGT